MKNALNSRFWLLGILLGLTAVACQLSGEPTNPPATITPPVSVEHTTEPELTTTALPLNRPTPGRIQDAENSPWWNDAVFYEVFVRSFYDSDGDGVGDLNGLIEQLDYLNDGDPTTNDDLGITGLWLMPIMESPSYHGYDVVDYYQVDEEYGTAADFQRLLEEAHARGIRVVVDLVLNHTSSEHPWFLEAEDPDSTYRDWFVWSEDNPGYRGPWGEQVWYRTDDGYYYAVFWEGMPDLNYENPEVTAAMYETAHYWLAEMGVDGFRLDAIKHLIEDGKIQENTKATHEWLQGFHSYYKEIDPEAFTVGEAWTGTQQVVDYTGDEVDIAFQFDLAEDIISASREGIGSLLTKSQAEVVESFPPGQYATFLTNHDQNRAMSQFRGDIGAAKIAASILLTSPGVPFIYYGEEIGMLGEKPDEDIRLPMQWSGEPPAAGFSKATPWRAPNANYPELNVADQTNDPDSLLDHYRDLIKLRNDNEALRIGDWFLIETEPSRLYAFLRQSDEQTILVLLNPSKKDVDDYSLSLDEGPLAGSFGTTLLYGEGNPAPLTVNELGGFSEYKPLSSLPSQSTFIFELSPEP